MNFTEGPWIVRSPNGRPGVYTAGGCKVAAVEAPHLIPALEREGRLGNCDLISAAPDLLAALKDVISCVEYVGRMDMSAEVWQSARAAVAKAEGRRERAETSRDLFDPK